MDLAEKRRKLEEIRAAREAKQRSVQQQLQQRQVCSTPTFVSFSNTRTPNQPFAEDVQLRGNSGNDSVVVVSAEKERVKGCVWSLEAGVGAISLGSTTEEKGNDKSDVVADVTAAVDSPVVLQGGASVYAKNRPQDDEASGKACVMSMVDTAMLRVYSLKTDSSLGCSGRCVLDVVMLAPNLLDKDVCDCSEDCYLIAAALSESWHVEEKSDGTRHLVTRRGSEMMTMQQSPSPLSSSVVVTGAILEPVGAPRGLVLLWFISRDKTNDVVYSVVPLCFGSEIRVLTYTRYCPEFLFGGAANGSVVVWRIDHALRDRHHAVLTTDSQGSPMLSSLFFSSVSTVSVASSEQSFPSPHSHHSRILAMAVHGDANYHHLYSVSQDGRVCVWALQHLRLPTSSRDGVISGQSVGYMGSCAAFVDKATDAMSKVVLGCLDGRVLEGRTKSSRVVEFSVINASSASITLTLPSHQHHPTEETLPHASWAVGAVDDGPAHRAAVVAVAPHPLSADPRISDTVLTAAVDGSCSLWLGSRRISIDGFSAQINCLRWSPKHPAVFVAGENNGRVAAWDLSRSSCSPVAFVYLCSVSSTSAGWAPSSSPTSSVNVPLHQSAAVTSLSFSDDGTWLTCGTASGELHLLRLRSDLVIEMPTAPTTVTKNPNYSLGQAESYGDTSATAGNYTKSSWIDARFVN